MKKVVLILGFTFTAFAHAAVIDHRHVDAVTNYPQATMNAIGRQTWFFSHASVGDNMMSGITALHTADTSYYRLARSSVSYNSGELRAANPPSPTTPGRIYDCQRGNPGWASKYQIFSNSIVTSGWTYSNVTFAMDKLCYIDQAADPEVYIQMMTNLEARFTNTYFVYTTMPLMTSSDSDNYLRNVYNNRVREHCTANDRLLFDIADMEAHDTNGIEYTFSYGGTNNQRMWTSYSDDGGHLNTLGQRRIARGWYAVAASVLPTSTVVRSSPLIIDHTCTDITQVPEYWIEAVKSNLNVHYAHTSHGSQINTGLEVLEGLHPRYGFASGYCSLPDEPDALRMYDGQIETSDISPDLYWETTEGRDLTMTVLNNNPALNVSLWAWCGQVSYYDTNQILQYLSVMSEFERQYPQTYFIYMTGHLDGSGTNGTLHLQNNMIRDYCRANNKILFDFADIESYDPDGNYFLDLDANDNCDYSGGNWATEYCTAHPGSELCTDCGWVDCCAHSQPLNCNLKGRAFWWMMARVAGWPGSPTAGSCGVESGAVHMGWSSLCTGVVYEIHRSTNMALPSDWSLIGQFTNRENGSDWNEPAVHPAAYYRLQKQ